MPAWPRYAKEPWTPRSLSYECTSYEAQMERLEQYHQEIQPGQLSENETEYDPEEAEALMNNVPSPRHQLWSSWTPAYEARRQARKRFWSPPYTPDEELGQPSYSLQPSQRRPSPTVRRHRSALRFQPTSPSSPQSADQLLLRLPPKAERRIRKA